MSRDIIARGMSKKAIDIVQNTNSVIYKGSVATEIDLPTIDNQIGYEYYVVSEGEFFIWNGISWDNGGGNIDMSKYLSIDNTIPYVPTEDYNPSTKIYVDESTLSLETNVVKSATIGENTVPKVNNNLSFPASPTTLPASDVYNWSKSSTKPSYTSSEIINNSLVRYDINTQSLTDTQKSNVRTNIGAAPYNLGTSNANLNVITNNSGELSTEPYAWKYVSSYSIIPTSGVFKFPLCYAGEFANYKWRIELLKLGSFSSTATKNVTLDLSQSNNVTIQTSASFQSIGCYRNDSTNGTVSTDNKQGNTNTIFASRTSKTIRGYINLWAEPSSSTNVYGDFMLTSGFGGGTYTGSLTRSVNDVNNITHTTLSVSLGAITENSKVVVYRQRIYN